jgi:hypothetical protein
LLASLAWGNIAQENLKSSSLGRANRICIKGFKDFPLLTGIQKEKCSKDPTSYDAAVQVRKHILYRRYEITNFKSQK